MGSGFLMPQEQKEEWPPKVIELMQADGARRVARSVVPFASAGYARMKQYGSPVFDGRCQNERV